MGGYWSEELTKEVTHLIVVAANGVSLCLTSEFKTRTNPFSLEAKVRYGYETWSEIWNYCYTSSMVCVII